MGSSLTSQSSTPFIQIDPTQHCQLFSQNTGYQVYQNQRGQLYEKYLVNKAAEQAKFNLNQSAYPKHYTDNRPSFQENYHYRLTHRSKYFVQLLYASPRQNAFSCNFNSKNGDYDVVTQRITHRLSQLYNLSFYNSLTILNIALKGFKNLYNYNGTLWIKDSMLGINQNLQVKVWFNHNFALNLIEPLPISLLNLTPQAQQDLIVNNLIDMVSSKTYPSDEWKELMKMRMEMKGRMNFDGALGLVETVINRFDMDEIRDNNKVFDLFNEGSNQQMIRENKQNSQKSPHIRRNSQLNLVPSTSNLVPSANNKPSSIIPQSNARDTPSVYPSKIKQIKSHTGIEHHLINQQMNGKPMYELRTNNQQLNFQIDRQKVNFQTDSNSDPSLNHIPQHIHTEVIVREINKNHPFVRCSPNNGQANHARTFHNPFAETVAEKKPINPFDELLKTQQTIVTTIPQYTYPSKNNSSTSKIPIHSNPSMMGHQRQPTNTSFKHIRDSIIAPNTHHPTTVPNMMIPQHNTHQILYPNHQPLSTVPSNQRVSFSNSQSGSNFINLPSNQASQQFITRQNSFMQVGNMPTAFNHSSLSQSPQNIVRFGTSIDSRGVVRDRGFINNGSMIRMGSNSNLANPLIQRRSTANLSQNFVTPIHYQSNYSQTLIKTLPHPPIPLVAIESPNRLSVNINRAQESPIKIVQTNLTRNEHTKRPTRTSEYKKPIIAQSIILMQGIKQAKEEQSRYLQIKLGDRFLNQEKGKEKSEALQIYSYKALELKKDDTLRDEQDIQMKKTKSVEYIQQLEPDEKEEQIMQVYVSPIKQEESPKQQEIKQQEKSQQSQQISQNLNNHIQPHEQNNRIQPYQQNNQIKPHEQNNIIQPHEQNNPRLLITQPHPQSTQKNQPPSNQQSKSTNLIVLSSYNQQDPNQQMMQISVNHCPTPDSSFVDEQQNLSEIPYDERQDEGASRNHDGEVGVYGQSSGFIIMETGKFIFDMKNQQGLEEKGHHQSQPYREYNNQTSNLLLANNNPRNSNNLTINNSTQTNHEPIANTLTNSNSQNIAKSNTSSDGMYKYELKDTVNFFSLNSLHSQQPQLNSYPQSHSNQIKRNQSQTQPIQQKAKQSLHGSQATTIINKLNKWDSNRFDFNESEKFNHLQKVNNLTTSDQVELDSPDFTNASHKTTTKVDQLFKKHTPSHQLPYSNSSPQQIRQQTLGDAHENQRNVYGDSYNNMQSTGQHKGSYMQSQYFSKYFNSINPESTKNAKTCDSPFDFTNQIPNPTQTITYPTAITQNLTYKQLRSLLNPSSEPNSTSQYQY